jgi:hypothetical protein
MEAIEQTTLKLETPLTQSINPVDEPVHPPSLDDKSSLIVAPISEPTTIESKKEIPKTLLKSTSSILNIKYLLNIHYNFDQNSSKKTNSLQLMESLESGKKGLII